MSHGRSKAKGLRPLEPRQGLSPWNPDPVSEERGWHGRENPRWLEAPLFADRNRIAKAQPLLGGQGAKPPGLTSL
jgi:hypothetical protein